MKKQLTVGVIKHLDVRGKEQLYLRVENILINIGEKTYNAVHALVNPEDSHAQLHTESTKEAKK